MSDSGILRFLYNTVPGRGILKILVNPKVSVLAGTFLNSRLSALYVPHFVKKNNIDLYLNYYLIYYITISKYSIIYQFFVWI